MIGARDSVRVCQVRLVALALVGTSFGCDPGVFDRPGLPVDAAGASGVSEGRDAGPRETGRDAGAQGDGRPKPQDNQDPPAGAGGDPPSAGAGSENAAGRTGDGPAAGAGGSTGQPGAAAGSSGHSDAGEAAAGGGGVAAGGGGDAAVGGDGSGGAGGAGETGGTGGAGGTTSPGDPGDPTCPLRPTEPLQAFCYDFEGGVKGPNDGEDFWLWHTPEPYTSAELDAIEWPAGSGNHVLQAVPPGVGEYSSATLGHDVMPLTRARVELDVWLDASLLATDTDVVFFRYVPNGEDFDRLTMLFASRGQLYLRTESGPTLYPFMRVPAAGERTHVSVVLDRSSACQVSVYFGAELVAQSAAEPCVDAPTGSFVEYGLVALGPLAGQVSAYYDDIAFHYE
ncbi:MAG: hypothetical protein ABW321_14625 [Polyangiales bacterium]